MQRDEEGKEQRRENGQRLTENLQAGRRRCCGVVESWKKKICWRERKVAFRVWEEFGKERGVVKRLGFFARA
jgi:hypothetical protein